MDGDKTSTSSRWVSSNSKVPHWLMVDLGVETMISGFDLYSGYNLVIGTGTATEPISSFSLQTSSDGVSNWIDIPDTVITGNNKYQVRLNFAPVTTRYVRLYVNITSSGYARVYDLMLYSPQPRPVCVINAYYHKSNNMLVDLVITDDVTKQYNPPTVENPQEYEVRQFVWEDILSMKPIIQD